MNGTSNGHATKTPNLSFVRDKMSFPSLGEKATEVQTPAIVLLVSGDRIHILNDPRQIHGAILAASQYDGKMEVAATTEEGRSDMEAYMKAIKTLIDRLDQDIRDHKQETRDRDARLQDEFKEREGRLMGAIDKIDQKIDRVEQKTVESMRWTITLGVTIILGVGGILATIWSSFHH